jgi:hypothetical protein
MPCDTVPAGKTQAQREAEVRRALASLEAGLDTGAIRLVIGANGAVAFAGWSAADRNYVTDVCAFRKLTAAGSSTLRRVLTREQQMRGRTVNMASVAAGTHSHDGGHTWSPGH